MRENRERNGSAYRARSSLSLSVTCARARSSKSALQSLRSVVLPKLSSPSSSSSPTTISTSPSSSPSSPSPSPSPSPTVFLLPTYRLIRSTRWPIFDKTRRGLQER